MAASPGDQREGVGKMSREDSPVGGSGTGVTGSPWQPGHSQDHQEGVCNYFSSD